MLNIKLKPQEAIQTLPTDFLVKALNGGIDINKLIHEELVSRGWSAKKDCWVGSMRSANEYEQRWGEDPGFN